MAEQSSLRAVKYQVLADGEFIKYLHEANRMIWFSRRSVFWKKNYLLNEVISQKYTLDQIMFGDNEKLKRSAAGGKVNLKYPICHHVHVSAFFKILKACHRMSQVLGGDP